MYNLAEDRSELNDLAVSMPELTTELSDLWFHVAENVDEAPRNLRKATTDKRQTFPASSMTQRKAGPKARPDAGKRRKQK